MARKIVSDAASAAAPAAARANPQVSEIGRIWCYFTPLEEGSTPYPSCSNLVLLYHSIEYYCQSVPFFTLTSSPHNVE